MDLPHPRPTTADADAHQGGPEAVRGEVAQVHSSLDQAAVSPYQEVPPPPPGYKTMGSLGIIYAVWVASMMWTGGCLAVFFEELRAGNSDDAAMMMFFAAPSIVVNALLLGWIIRIHRRRGVYRRILDDSYESLFGYHPGRI
ncbi:hypothetical protein [Nesterenkonia sphaerica]|uniref:Uncharacterized protein n=1 Tax=Nesterenkonia sphaerica TaxID=1804988 RepID=A0A5R9AML7_9MICC|nr:hypothetical protein [Nesterenkonia sphaerica]TLP80068.1 hypothetical protein FEF27_01480 [Nesterenkonia sphaerica]